MAENQEVRPICVASATDDTYLLPWLVFALSLKISNPHVTLVLGYFENELSHLSLEVARQFAEVIDLDLEIYPLGTQDEEGHRYISKTTFAKFSFLMLLPKPFIWIDSDTVVSGDLSRLQVLQSSASRHNSVLVAKGHGDANGRFNAGFFVALDDSAEILGWKDHLRRDGHNLENYIFVEKWAELTAWVHASYNVVSPWGKPSKNETPVISHFAGSIKPWHIDPVSRDACRSSQCNWAIWFDSLEKLREVAGDSNGADFDSALLKQLETDVSPPRGINPIATSIIRQDLLGRQLSMAAKNRLIRPAVSFLLGRKGIVLHNCHPVH